VGSADHVVHIMGGTYAGLDLVVNGWGNALNSNNPEEVHVQPWIAGGSKTLSALVGTVDC